MNNCDPYFQFPLADVARVCGYLRTLMALEGITDWQACELLGVPVKLLDTAAFRESLKPQDLESVK